MKYEKWSLGYWIVKQYIRFADWIIHNKTIMLNTDKIPKNKPILFTPNHQNALCDPMAILLNTKFQPVWLARADIFKNKFVITILRFLKIMPVYRMRDGKDQLAKNDETFASSVKILEKHRALALFPEAAHTGKRQMIAHKKAAPRIVFMAEERAENNLDIQIVPAGIYYSSYWKFNRNRIVNFGDPIPANQFLEEYKENPSAAILTMRNRIYEGVEPLVIDIRSNNHYQDFENITEIYGNHFLAIQNKKYSIVNLFKSNQALANKLDKMETENPEQIKELAKDVNEYKALLKKHKVRNWLVENNKNNFLKIAGNKLILIAGLPIFLFGLLFNAIPFFSIDITIRKKIKDVAFWSSFFLALGIIVFPIIYLVEFFALSWLIPWIWLKLAFLVSLPFAGKIAFKWYILFRKTAGRSRLLILKMFHENKYQDLITQKENLYKSLDELLSS